MKYWYVEREGIEKPIKCSLLGLQAKYHEIALENDSIGVFKVKFKGFYDFAKAKDGKVIECASMIGKEVKPSVIVFKDEF